MQALHDLNRAEHEVLEAAPNLAQNTSRRRPSIGDEWPWAVAA
jgi:hypothetical protein